VSLEDKLRAAAVHLIDGCPAEATPVPYTAELPDDRVGRLELLVRWLAQPYGTNTPVFAVHDWRGDPLATGEALRDLYLEVVGPKDPFPGEWYECPSCGMWQVRARFDVPPVE
jgi:hypothetical protein